MISRRATGFQKRHPLLGTLVCMGLEGPALVLLEVDRCETTKGAEATHRAFRPIEELVRSMWGDWWSGEANFSIEEV